MNFNLFTNFTAQVGYGFLREMFSSGQLILRVQCFEHNYPSASLFLYGLKGYHAVIPQYATVTVLLL